MNDTTQLLDPTSATGKMREKIKNLANHKVMFLFIFQYY